MFDYWLNKFSTHFRKAAFMTLLVKLSLFNSVTAYAEQINGKVIHLHEMVENIINYYPSVDIAAIEVLRARQEFVRVESSLGWVLTAHAGVSRDVSFIDSPTDHAEAGVGAGRTYESGSSLELSGVYTYDESETGFSSFSPNPSERTRLDVKYRIPFAQGDGNPEYIAGKANAEAGVLIQRSSQILKIDSLVQQAARLYFDLLSTYTRIQDAEKALLRAIKLQEFTIKNRRLGLAERKDVLRVESLIKRQIAQRDSLFVVWQQQKTELNRLMGKPAGHAFVPRLYENHALDSVTREKLKVEVMGRDPELAIEKNRLVLAESEVSLARDARRNKLDLVMSIGSRTVKGDTLTGEASDSEMVGGALLEYRSAIDKSGFDAALYQSLLQKEKSREEIKRIEADVLFRIENIWSQYNANKKAVKSNLAHYRAEQGKLKEAYSRHRAGRATTAEIVDYEESLQVSYVQHQNQKIAMSRNLANMALLMGMLWHEDVLNRYKPELTGLETGE